ncbi:MAG: hypothetical protein QOD08_911, partial [Gaiellaceae bacterium]|nr:hypothetical protein [Gaiellaceae bacterium]
MPDLFAATVLCTTHCEPTFRSTNTVMALEVGVRPQKVTLFV